MTLDFLSPSGRPIPWWVVAASFCALLLGPGTMTFALGVFLKPVTAELGISRGVFSTGMLLFALLGALACPLLGKALDQWGSRRVLLPLILAYAAAVAGLSQLSASPTVVFALFAITGLFSVGLTPIAYARSVSLRFDTRRGLALGLTIAGVGFGVALMPPILGNVIAAAGWRTAFLVFAALIIAVALVPVALFVNDPPVAPTRHPGANDSALGMSPREAFASWRFWAMLLAFFFAIVAVNGTVSHMVTLLVDRGLALGDAVRTVSAVGMAAIVSRIVCGWLLDRLSGPGVAVLFFVVPIGGIALVLHGGTGTLPLMGALLLGMAIGAEVDILAYFVGRYFGLRSFGVVYGVLFAVFGVGSGVGPFLSGMAFDRFKTYDGIFGVYQALLVIACLLVLRLGAYPFGQRHPGAAAPAGNGQLVH